MRTPPTPTPARAGGRLRNGELCRQVAGLLADHAGSESPRVRWRAGCRVGVGPRDADPDGFPERHRDWHTWRQRARLARTLANMLGVAVEQVSVINDRTVSTARYPVTY